jgi:hypothetical protein
VPAAGVAAAAAVLGQCVPQARVATGPILQAATHAGPLKLIASHLSFLLFLRQPQFAQLGLDPCP